MTTETTTAAPVNRYFYRCTGCLEVCALDQRIPMQYSASIATCTICGSHFEYMGRVERDRLVTDHTACVCDDRCTFARGPLCQCKCGGKHHGIGMAGYYATTTDRGPVPTVRPATGDRADKARRQFEEFSREQRRLRMELNALLDRKNAGEYLTETAFRRLRQLQHVNRRIAAYRIHAGRMRTLAAVLGPAAPVPAAIIETPAAPIVPAAANMRQAGLF